MQRQQQPGARDARKDVLFNMAVATLEATEEWTLVSTTFLVLSSASCLYWLYTLEMVIERKGMTLVCYLFMAFMTAFVSIMRRDRREAELRAKYTLVPTRRGTDARYMLARLGLVVAILITYGGWYWMPLTFQVKGYLGFSGLTLVASVFIHCKTIRDAAEAANLRTEYFGDDEGKQQ